MKNSKYILAGMSAFCLVLITATSIKSSFLMPLRTGVGFVLVPLQSGVNAIGTGLYNTLENFSSLREAQEENKNLQMRLDQMVEENNRLQSELYELDRLRELYQLDQEYMQYEKIAARVIAKDSGNWFQVFRIDKGADDGIQEDMNVMAGGGLVGIVTDVGANYATVRAIIDDDSNVSGMSLRTGDTCNVSGNLTLYQDGRLGLDHIKKEADIQEGDKIVTERFEVIEQVHDCRVLFEQLQASLSSGWEHYFSEASIYYAEHGNLNVPKLYTTPGGLSLGVWLVTQRRVREGQIQGNLTEQQIARLDSIGMVWGNRKEIAWQHGFEVAKKYHDTYGNLMVPGKYVDPDGYPLGQWIIKTRQQKLNGRLKEERIAQLDEIGMVWNIFDAKWEKAYALAAAYYEENGNLNIPRSYVTAAGERLGQWVASQQWAYPKGKLTDEQVERLNRIGMYWGNRNDRQWNEGYQEAKRYFDAHGNLNVPAEYVSPGGYNLGTWVKRQRYTRQNPEKSCAVLTEERIAKLDAIGMRWEKADSRLRRLELAQESKRERENLNVSAKHKTGEDIGLCS